MSGTSLDGLDVVSARLWWCLQEHRFRCEAVQHASFEFPDALKAPLLAWQHPESHFTMAALGRVQHQLTYYTAHCIEEALQQWQLPKQQIEAVAWHGQTVLHVPSPISDLAVSTPATPTEPPPLWLQTANQRGHTLQLGDGATLAGLLQRQVIHNFRPMDMAFGGQGAPLVPFFDALFFKPNAGLCCVQNLGGIGNVTVLGGASPIAFDTGPANMMLDGLTQWLFSQPYDTGGAFAAQGSVLAPLLSELQSHPFYQQAPPKSTGREAFGRHYWQPLAEASLRTGASPHDVLATFTYLTAWSIADAYARWVPLALATSLQQLPPIEQVVLCGGGAYNTTLTQYLKECLSAKQPQHTPPTLCTMEDFGIANSAKEALAFACLGWANVHRLPSSLPSCTGATQAVSLGQVSRY